MANKTLTLLRLFIVLIGCGVTSARAGIPDLGHDTALKLQSKRKVYSLHAPDFGHALILLAKDFKIPMGLEWIRSQQTLKQVDLTWHDASVRQMIDRVVSAQPGYTVQINHGIVGIFPVAEHDKTQNFLDLHIKTFQVKNQVVEIASRQLRDSVRTLLSPSNSEHRAGFASSQATSIGDPIFTLSVENSTVRQILNRFIVLSDRRIWVVTFVSDKSNRQGFWPTATLWTDADVPESEQPVWDLLRWSDSIP